MTATIKSKAGKGKSDEWNVEDAEIIFSFQHQDVDYPPVGCKAFPKDSHWTLFTTTTVENSLNEILVCMRIILYTSGPTLVIINYSNEIYTEIDWKIFFNGFP